MFAHGFLSEPNRVYLTSCDGHFTDATFPRLVERDGQSINAELGDINGDAVIDIIIGNSAGFLQPESPS